jgi:hypothetical protein
MATIKELVKEINEYLNPNIDKYESKDSKTYKINDVWIDKINDKYFFNETLFLLQSIENTILKTNEPILIIKRIHHIFKNRIVELNKYKIVHIEKYLTQYHRYSLVDFNDSIVLERYKKECKKLVTQDLIDSATEKNIELFKLKSFCNLPFINSVHLKADVEDKKLLFHLDRYIDEVYSVLLLLDDIVYDYENFKMVVFDDYFKSYYNIHTRKIKVDLKLKDMAYFFYFVLETELFKFHPEKKMNKKLLVDFFEKNFMYSDIKGTPKEFNMFVKHISDAANEHKRFKTAFINEMKTKLEKFDKIDLSTLLRKYEM